MSVEEYYQHLENSIRYAEELQAGRNKIQSGEEEE